MKTQISKLPSCGANSTISQASANVQRSSLATLLEAKGITKTYAGTNKAVLDKVDLAVHKGEFLSILGRSGSGKSTLLNVLSSLVLPDSGQVLLEGVDICASKEAERNRLRRSVFAMVFQQHHLMPYLSALENVLLPFMGGIVPVSLGERQLARVMLVRVGLKDKENSPPRKLSGGEQQRVAIARALARGGRILFADEPTGSLDSATGASIMELLHELNKGGVTIVMVTHNPEYAAGAHRSVVMEDGRMIS